MAHSILPTIITLPDRRDDRGTLVFANPPDDLPFVPRHYFLLTDLTIDRSRGAHAHRRIAQAIHCVAGACRIDTIARDGSERAILLNHPTQLMLSPPLTWITLTPLAPHTHVVVFSDHPYDADDYIRDRDEFLRLIGRGAAS